MNQDLAFKSFHKQRTDVFSPKGANRVKTTQGMRYIQKFEYEFENEFRKIVRNHKKAEKCMAPLAFPIKELEWRRRHGMLFSEVSTPKSSMHLSQTNSNSKNLTGARNSLVESQGQDDVSTFMPPIILPTVQDTITPRSIQTIKLNLKHRNLLASKIVKQDELSTGSTTFSPRSNKDPIFVNPYTGVMTPVLNVPYTIAPTLPNSTRNLNMNRTKKLMETIQNTPRDALQQKVHRRRQNFRLNSDFLCEKRERSWMKNRGRYHLLDFSDDELKKLKECFRNLDDDGSGSIGIDELEIPLIGLGFADSREEVEEIVREVDEDGSGQIEFDEFLLIIKNSNSDSNNKTAKIHKFFKDMSNGNLGSKDLSFNVIVQNIRRQHMMNALIAKDKTGSKILKNVENYLKMTKKSIESSDF